MSKKIPLVRQFEIETDRRYAFAKALFDMQDEATQDVILRMVDKMFGMAGEAYIKIRDQTLPYPYELQQRNFLWCAMRIVITLARMDIQVGNFTPTPNACVECGTQVERRRVKKKVTRAVP